jgi:hypothetical protein
MTNRFCNLGASHYAGATVASLTGVGFVAEAAQPLVLVAFATKVFA